MHFFVQILFNLALAYYYDNDVEEAEQVLMEAFHNTEDYDPYRKHIMCAIETLKVGSSHRGKYIVKVQMLIVIFCMFYQ